MPDLTDANIAHLAASVGCELKPGVLEILKQSGSFDVQACPGSGKTTTAAAKVVIALSGWNSRGGICVLTHTNVAKREIVERVSKSDIGRRALEHPHFIGTIHSFVNRFVALPYLRAVGNPFSIADDHEFEKAAVEMVSRNSRFRTMKTYLEKRRMTEAYRFLEYAHDSDTLLMSGKPPTIRHDTETYKQLVLLKTQLSARGIFRFGDMFHYANKSIDKWPFITDVLQKRFPWIIIDEMQDTTVIQNAALERIFIPSSCTVQRFGDKNQQIYQLGSEDKATTSFPKQPLLKLEESGRFGTFIADALTLIAANPQRIRGNTSRPTGAKHTIFLFDEGSVKNVLPTFASLAASSLRGLCETPVIKAIGCRANAAPSSTIDTIGDYGMPVSDTKLARLVGEDSLYLHCRRAQIIGNNYLDKATREVYDGIRVLIGHWGADPQTNIRRIRDSIPWRRQVGTFILSACESDLINNGRWQTLIDPLVGLLSMVIGAAITPQAKRYLRWVTVAHNKPSTREFTESSDPVIVQTIHSCKGETHDATLVLETKYHKHDVRNIF